MTRSWKILNVKLSYPEFILSTMEEVLKGFQLEADITAVVFLEDLTS